jgi:hypothetical protein
MDEWEKVLQGFNQGVQTETEVKTANDFLGSWDNPTQERTPYNPREEDARNLEAEIRGIYEDRKLLNRALATLLAVATASAGINSIAKIGLPIMATGTLGGLVLAVFSPTRSAKSS